MHKVPRRAFALVAALLVSASAQAQLFRAYLAPTGVDTNPCTLGSPCRLLPAALTAVASGGEIWMLDSANYNASTVTIGKSVSILAVPGAVGSVVASGGPAISITAPGLKVSLRNLVIVPLVGAGGTDGLNMTAASTVTIENSVLAGLPGTAVNITGGATVAIADSIIRDSTFGAQVLDGSHLAISSSKIIGNHVGLWAHALTATFITLAVSDTFLSNNRETALSSSEISGGTTEVYLTRSTIEGASLMALECAVSAAGGSSVITLNATTIVHNAGPFSIAGAGSAINTMGNNQITNNGPSGGALTPIGLQ